MAKLLSLPHLAIIDGFKGTIDYYLYMGIPVARRWPRSPGKRRAPAVEAQWPAWTTATRLWGEMSPAVQEAYRLTSTGSTMSGRDMAQKAYLVGYIHPE